MDWGDVGNFGKGFILGGPLGGAINAGTGGAVTGAIFNDPGSDAEKQRKELLYQQAAAAGGFAQQGQQGYKQLGQRATGALDYLQGQTQGQNSVSAEQLRQGLAQNQAQQMSMAAGASPQNSAMAARTAAMQMGRLGAGLSGQQAIAGLQERNQAMQQYASLLEALRQQELQAALQSRANAMQGYGAQNAGTPEKSNVEKYGPMVRDALSAFAAKSDRRAKTDIKDGDEAANKAISGLGAYLYKYKDERDGKGERLGVMAQGLEKAGLGHAVIDTPQGKIVHGAHLATATAAMVGALGRRLAKLEGTSK